MSRITASKPAAYATVTGPRLHNVFYPGEILSFTLSTAGATSYIVRDYYGTVVETGSVSGTLITLQASHYEGKLGWWRLALSGADAGDSAYGTDKGSCSFVIFEDDSNYPADPLRSSNPANTGGLDDAILHGVIGAGMIRQTMALQVSKIRNGVTVKAAMANSVSATMPAPDGTYSILSVSFLDVIHTFVGADHTGMACATSGFTQIAAVDNGNVGIRVYRKYGPIAIPVTVACTSGAATGVQTITLTEHAWLNNESLQITPIIFSGTGTSASFSVDGTSLGSSENIVTSVIGWDALVSGVTLSGLTADRGNGTDVVVTENVFGTGLSKSVNATWIGSATYAGVAYIERAKDTYSTSIASNLNALSIINSWYLQYGDGVRLRPKLVAAGGSTIGVESKMTKVANDYYAAGWSGLYFEGRNEPQGNYDLTNELQPFAAAVSAANSGAGAQSVASGYVSLCENGNLSEWLGKLDAGMAGMVDVLAFHDYNMCNGDLRNAIPLYEKIEVALITRSITKPLFVTEGGHDTTWGGWSSSAPSAFVRTHDAGSALLKHTLVKEIVLGLMPEQTYYYYDRRGGYDSVTTWQSTSTGIYPGYAMLRTYTAGLRGKTLESRLDFGDGRYHYLGGVWSVPDRSGAKIAVIIADSVGLDPVSCYLSGNPGSVTVYDCFGNVSTINATNGAFELTATDVPQYIAIPANVSFDVRPFRWGPDLLSLQTLNVSNDADSAAAVSNLKRMVDGDLRSAYYYGSANNTTIGSVYVDTTGTFPKTMTLVLPFSTVQTSRIMVGTPVPWQDTQGVLLDFDIQYQRALDSTWVTVGTFVHDAISTIKNYSYDDDTSFDCYTVPQTVWIADMGDTQVIKGVRLIIRDASAGMYLDAAMLGPYRLTKRTTIRAVQSLDVPAAQVVAILTG